MRRCVSKIGKSESRPLRGGYKGRARTSPQELLNRRARLHRREPDFGEPARNRRMKEKLALRMLQLQRRKPLTGKFALRTRKRGAPKA